jgi:hypothetical protein
MMQRQAQNPAENQWGSATTDAIISPDGLTASVALGMPEEHVYAIEGFPIVRRLCRNGNFPGTILYYYEVTEVVPSEDEDYEEEDHDDEEEDDGEEEEDNDDDEDHGDT